MLSQPILKINGVLRLYWTAIPSPSLPSQTSSPGITRPLLEAQVRCTIIEQGICTLLVWAFIWGRLCQCQLQTVTYIQHRRSICTPSTPACWAHFSLRIPFLRKQLMRLVRSYIRTLVLRPLRPPMTLLLSRSRQSSLVCSKGGTQQLSRYGPSTLLYQRLPYCRIISTFSKTWHCSDVAKTVRSELRYRVSLNAPTAMVRHPDEIPVTYLNKGQAYSISISDSQPIIPSPAPIKYRTVIRISFEDEQQRQRPSACWQLWKEGRGLAEAHLRAGRLQAVEYVDPIQGGDEETKRPRIELQTSSFDCFSVIWTPVPNASTAECSVGVRFNFLSTDFSHSKGVKGIPVRLCAKNEIISSGTPDSPPGPSSEVAFCKVKLFRDHGAERKLSNDIAHIRKTIDKLKHQIAQSENGLSQTGKRKRSGSKGGGSRPAKVQKHKRSWSVSSNNSGGRPVIDDDLHTKLASTEDMFSSTRPVSVLNLKGYLQDDPDAFPVKLPGHVPEGSGNEPSSRKTSWDRRQSVGTSQATPTTSCNESPTPSSRSMHSQPQSHERAALPKSTRNAPSHPLPEDWDHFPSFPGSQLHTLAVEPTMEIDSQAIKIQKGQADESFPDWFEALGVDPSYKPPPERPVKPIACFYVFIKVMGTDQKSDYYRAVYLMERTVNDLVKSIATKCQVDPSRVSHTIRVNSRGLKIMVDDEVVQELPEGQDMAVEFSELESMSPWGHEQRNSSRSPLELRLLF